MCRWHYIESLPKGGVTMSITFWYRVSLFIIMYLHLMWTHWNQDTYYIVRTVSPWNQDTLYNQAPWNQDTLYNQAPWNQDTLYNQAPWNQDTLYNLDNFTLESCRTPYIIRTVSPWNQDTLYNHYQTSLQNTFYTPQKSLLKFGSSEGVL